MQEVVICNSCDGHGYLTKHEITCYHRREYDVIKFGCHKCKGSGRLVKTTTISYKPLELDGLHIIGGLTHEQRVEFYEYLKQVIHDLRPPSD
jgi:hypothetical protein